MTWDKFYEVTNFVFQASSELNCRPAKLLCVYFTHSAVCVCVLYFGSVKLVVVSHTAHFSLDTNQFRNFGNVSLTN